MMRIANSRRGQVLPIAVVMGLVLMSVCVLTVDVGQICWKRAQLQNGADAASLAAMQQVVELRRIGTQEQQCRVAGEAEGLWLADVNCPDARYELTFGNYEEASGFVPAGSGETANACMVKTIRDGLALFFAPVIGMNTTPVSASAVAQACMDIKRVHERLMPFGVWGDDVLPEGDPMVFYPAGGDPGHELIIPGIFGLLDFNGGSNDTPELKDWLDYGYNDGFSSGDGTGVWVEGDTGFRPALEPNIAQWIDQEIVICVYDECYGEGAGGLFHVTGFLSLTLTAVDLGGGEPYITGVVGPLLPVSWVDVGTGGIPSPNLARVVLVQ